MNFVVAMLILGRIVDTEYAPDMALISSPKVEPIDPKDDTGSVPDEMVTAVGLNLDPNSSWCRAAEFEVFKFLLSLVDKKSIFAMQTLWQSGQAQIKLRSFQLDYVLKWMIPKLHQHFRQIQLTPGKYNYSFHILLISYITIAILLEVLVAQWFVTLFSYTVPIKLTMAIWDYIFVEGWPGVFQVTISLLRSFEETMLSKDVEGVSLLLLFNTKSYNMMIS
jgi:hypothetical protein